MVIRAQISSVDKEQDLDTRLLRLRDFCDAQGWSICKKYIDKASAANFTVKIIGKKMGRRRVTDRQGFSTPATKLFWSASRQGIFQGAGLPESWVSVMLP